LIPVLFSPQTLSSSKNMQFILQLNAVCLVLLALKLFEFGRVTPAMAQTTYPFQAKYNVSLTGQNITPNLVELFISGEDADAPYGLTSIQGLGYTQIDSTTGFFSSNTDPTAFGLQDVPSGSITFSGSNSDKLFVSGRDNGVIDFATSRVNSSGAFNITGGSGKFENATGMLALSPVEPLSYQLGVSLKGQVKIDGAIESVPEPANSIMLLSMGVVIGGSFLLRQRRF